MTRDEAQAMQMTFVEVAGTPTRCLLAGSEDYQLLSAVTSSQP